ncbi:histidine phosphatase family protein [Streptomyces sp. NBC_00094]|uniref:histidine phosphatase family protein n=1 Tax=Streptomyces sp. NBC_00094 TaxID=2903620 RepID=UPI00224DF8A3|nr:histidine phosphatase family protein [Streptomyces sp. NBC_00094]MCX5391717.1 histidine phosphatase family protein [Streptomyces sp. NBC_00094]
MNTPAPERTPERTVRLVLVAPAVNAALLEGRFDDDSPVKPGESEPGRTEPVRLGRTARVFVSPSVRCRSTAGLLGLPEAEDVAALAGCAMGRWRGRRLDELATEEPESVAAWLADPDAVPHGGEALRSLWDRVAGWVDALEPGTVWAVAEPDVIRAAVAHALGAPGAAFWRLDVRPLSRVALSGRSGRWNVVIGSRLD